MKQLLRVTFIILTTLLSLSTYSQTPTQPAIPLNKNFEINKEKDTSFRFPTTRPSLNEEGEEFFKVVEKMPRFPGCENVSEDKVSTCSTDKMLNYIYNDIKYPAEARKKGIEGTVVIQFVVRKDGSLTDFKGVRGIGGGCDQEAWRIVTSMPNWIPGTQRGRKVDVQYALPIKFKLQ